MILPSCQLVGWATRFSSRWEDIAEGRREGGRLQANYPGPRWNTTNSPFWDPLAEHFVNRDHYVLGGMHMTNLAFLPNALLKEITATEYRRSITSFYNNHFTLKDLDEQQVQ